MPVGALYGTLQLILYVYWPPGWMPLTFTAGVAARLPSGLYILMVMVALDQTMLPVFLTVTEKLTVRRRATGSGLSETETMLPLVILLVELVIVLVDAEVEDVEVEVMVAVVVLVATVLVD